MPLQTKLTLIDHCFPDHTINLFFFTIILGLCWFCLSESKFSLFLQYYLRTVSKMKQTNSLVGAAWRLLNPVWWWSSSCRTWKKHFVSNAAHSNQRCRFPCPTAHTIIDNSHANLLSIYILPDICHTVQWEYARKCVSPLCFLNWTRCSSSYLGTSMWKQVDTCHPATTIKFILAIVSTFNCCHSIDIKLISPLTCLRVVCAMCVFASNDNSWIM